MRSGDSDHVEQEELQPRNGMEYLFAVVKLMTVLMGWPFKTLARLFLSDELKPQIVLTLMPWTRCAISAPRGP